MTVMGLNDFMGMGAGIAALGDARVTINDSDIHLSSVTRCAVHAGGKMCDNCVDIPGKMCYALIIPLKEWWPP